jgi:hypothetical protein
MDCADPDPVLTVFPYHPDKTVLDMPTPTMWHFCLTAAGSRCRIQEKLTNKNITNLVLHFKFYLYESIIWRIYRDD